MADAEITARHLDDARRHARELIMLGESAGFAWARASGLALQARLHRHADEPAAAECAGLDALELAATFPATAITIDVLETLAGLAAESGSHDEAARLLGAAQTLRNNSGYSHCAPERAQDIAALCQVLQHAAFQAAYQQGSALPASDALAYARRGRGQR